MDSARRTVAVPWGALIVVAAVLVGLLARVLPGMAGSSGGLMRWLPWAAAPTVTLYYPDASGRYLVPVSMAVPGELADPATVATALASEPPAGLGLEDMRKDAALTREARAQTIAAWPEAAAVEGLDTEVRVASRLLHFVAGELIVAVPSEATTPREAIEAYLAGPGDAALVGLPIDVQLLGYEHDAHNGLLRVNLRYSPAVRTLATEQPETMRRILLGLIATLTSFPEVQAVMLDFEGHARLGVGQCAELLRTPQRRPAILNDARLLQQGR